MANTEKLLAIEKEEFINTLPQLIDIHNQYLKEKAIATQYGPQSFSLQDEQALKRQLISANRLQWLQAQERSKREKSPIPASVAFHEPMPKFIVQTGHSFSFWKRTTPSASPSQEVTNKDVKTPKKGI